MRTDKIGPQNHCTFLLVGPDTQTKFEGIKHDAILAAHGIVNDYDTDPEEWIDDDSNTVVGYPNGPQVTIIDIGE